MTTPNAGQGFATRAIHAGQDPETAYRATVTPIYPTSVFTFEDVSTTRGYDYGRHGNPTRTAMEECLASLEGAEYAVAFSSGMAAVDAALRLIPHKKHLLLSEDIYGGTRRLVEDLLRPAGLEASYADASDPRAFADKMQDNTAMVWLESPTNPLTRLVDISAIANFAHARNAIVAVDNTFASPYFQNPLALGADLVMHSTTKYLGGHSDLVGGALVTNDPQMHAKISVISRVAGAVPSPFDSWLTLRGMKTLAVRMEQHARSAMSIATAMENHPSVSAVHYPGLLSHPQHALATHQMRGFGGIVALDLKGGAEAAVKLLEGVRLFTLTGSLGGVESIISYPARMSHVFLSAEERHQRGISDGLVRLSVGLEDTADLIADLNQALRA
jgi:cystathionine beta-lyase/cystathionine gamma-synthase